MDREFRHDINALRALAVVAVLLFHFRVPGFAGGFVGVDVFFVISGYLMASIILTRLQQNTFSIGRFYLARLRRIVPALAIMILTLLAGGWFVLPPNDYRELAANGIYALMFIANIRFARDAGYFEADSHDNWLLHTWSLAVEAQFYLLLPVLLLILWRLKLKNSLLPILAILMLVSLARSCWLAQHSPDSAFFLLQSRAWQLLAGAIVFLIAGQSVSLKLQNFPRSATATGLLLIVARIFSVDANTVWPGLAVMAPVAGTAIILLAGHQAAWMRLAPVRYLGLSSYSVYLWHWPVVVALVFLGFTDSPLAVASGIVLALILGFLSWRLVENPGRQASKPALRLVAILTLALVPAGFVYLQDGINGRLPAAAERAAAEAWNIDPRRDECMAGAGDEFPWCRYGGSDIRAMVVGDSHASSLFTAVAAAVQKDEPDNPDAGILASAYNGCPTLLEGSSRDSTEECRAFNDYLMAKTQTVASDVPLIIVNRSSVYHLGSSIPGDKDYQRPLLSYGQPHARPHDRLTNQYFDDLVATACHFAGQRPVYLVRPIPEMRVDVPRSMARRHVLNQTGEVRLRREIYDRRQAAVWQAQDRAVRQCGVQVLDPTEVLCDQEYCYGSQNGRPLYYDEDHLSEFGNKTIIRPLLVPQHTQMD
mgnify:FL=1